MDERIVVYAPATIANVSVGFDVLGLAICPIDGQLLGDKVILQKSANFNLKVIGQYSRFLPINKKDNIVYKSWELFCDTTGQKIPVEITLEKNMPIGSGLGSSACSIVASLVALNNYIDNSLNQHQMLELMGILEGEISNSIHYDNVAPCFLGGMQLIVNHNNEISQPLPIFDQWYWIVAYSGINVSTAEARKILPTQYSKQVSIEYGKNLAGFVRALYEKEDILATKFMQDSLAEPYREVLLPKFMESKEYLLANNALAAGISGSGPTLFAITKTLEQARDFAQWLEKNYIQNQEGFVKICKASKTGAIIKRE